MIVIQGEWQRLHLWIDDKAKLESDKLKRRWIKPPQVHYKHDFNLGIRSTLPLPLLAWNEDSGNLTKLISQIPPFCGIS